MPTGRTTAKHTRFYMDGYDLSGFARQVGDLSITIENTPDAALTDAVKNILIGRASLGVGMLNAFLDNTAATGLHGLANTPGLKRTVMVPIGIQAPPAQGSPVFCGEFEQVDYKLVDENSYVVAHINFGDVDAVAQAIAYIKPWGTLLHPKQAEVGVNASAGVDDNGAQTLLGGFACYQIFSSNGTVTVKVQDSADNAAWADLAGATSGSQDATTTPVAGIVALARTATVRRYLRWQLVFGTATTVSFALGFVRATF